MKVNYKRLAAGREAARHYEMGFKKSHDRRKDGRNEKRQLREELFAR